MPIDLYVIYEYVRTRAQTHTHTTHTHTYTNTYTSIHTEGKNTIQCYSPTQEGNARKHTPAQTYSS